ncbi:MAG: metal ABC transporter permease [Deltaproteobacteria bacterium]|nr:metal ABC transporter permease [Deltaproteobacteria bacterium]
MNPAAVPVGVVDDVVDALSRALAALAAAGALPPAFAHSFLAKALLAVLVVTPLFGALGVLVTARRLAFFSTALGQAAMAGVAVGVALGEPVDAPWVGLLGTTGLCAVWLVVLRRHGRLPADTLTGVFLALSLAAGVAALVVVTRRFNVHQLEAVLFGSPLTVRSADLVVVAVVAVGVAVIAAGAAPALLLDALDPGLAAAAGRRAFFAELAFVVALAAAVVVASRVVGALLVEALLVLPAATARAWGAGLGRNVVTAVVVALASGVLGLVVSAATPVPAGAAMVLVGGVFFVGAVVLGGRGR